ncbi:MAG: VTT domain-containing protein [Patescibacteria group bacterium]
MHTVNILNHLIENYQILVYFFIFLGLIVEGEFILISTGILLHLGALSFYFVLVFVFLGLLCKTLLGYYIGSLIYDKWNHTKFLKYIEKRVLKVMPHFKQKPFWSIFISKFIWGVNNIVIIFSGYQKINFKKYLKAELYSSIIWVPALVLLGYLFSYTALRVSDEIWKFFFVVLILIIMFIVLHKLMGWAYEIFEEFYHDHNGK